jgi:hypothetical protein
VWGGFIDAAVYFGLLSVTMPKTSIAAPVRKSVKIVTKKSGMSGLGALASAFRRSG